MVPCNDLDLTPTIPHTFLSNCLTAQIDNQCVNNQFCDINTLAMFAIVIGSWKGDKPEAVYTVLLRSQSQSKIQLLA